MFETVKRIIVDELGIDESTVVPEASLTNELGISSVEFLNVIMAVEEELDINTDENKLRTLNTVSELADYIDSLVISKNK